MSKISLEKIRLYLVDTIFCPPEFTENSIIEILARNVGIIDGDPHVIGNKRTNLEVCRFRFENVVFSSRLFSKDIEGSETLSDPCLRIVDPIQDHLFTGIVKIFELEGRLESPNGWIDNWIILASRGYVIYE